MVDTHLTATAEVVEISTQAPPYFVDEFAQCSGGTGTQLRGERPTTGGSRTALIDDPPVLTQSFQPFYYTNHTYTSHGRVVTLADRRLPTSRTTLLYIVI